MAKAKCAECGERYAPRQAQQLFCAAPCKTAYHNRMAKRGKVLTPLLMASRTKRETATSREAYVRAYRLVSDWNDEDKAAGRMAAWRVVDHQLRMGLRG